MKPFLPHSIGGAVDTSLTLVEERRGSRRAKLFRVGRDIEYREMELERNVDNVWKVISDSRDVPELLFTSATIWTDLPKPFLQLLQQ